jgi:hypothetical protein
MTKRYIPSSRTSSGGSSNTSTDQLRDQFLRDLTQQANALLKQLSDQFTQDLQSQSAQLLSGLFGGESNGIAGLSQLVATGSKYLVSQRVASQSTAESSRSLDTNAQFRLSQSQALAEANLAISKGEKNL